MIYLDDQIKRILRETGTEQVAIAFHDYENQTSWSIGGDRWFHAASTIKVAILMGLFALIEDGAFEADSPVHVRNRFLSVANGEAFRTEPSRDGCQSLYGALGETRPLSELAYHMIVTSSNLATNLLIEAAGVDALIGKLEQLGVGGIELKRGVEDELAFEQEINNRVTANGLQQLFGLLYESDRISPGSREQMLDILFAQKFNRGLPMGLPPDLREQSRIAHKTGEISTVAHDAGLVYLPERKPYSLVILTERTPGKTESRKAIRRLSRLVFRNFVSHAS